MSEWLSRAKNALSGRAAETVPEPIELPCPCGRKIEAVRRGSFQRVLCKGCGEPFFVLPLDVYPRPVLKKVRPAKVLKASPSAKSAVTPADSAAAVTVIARPAIDIWANFRQSVGTLRRQFTPLRLIVLSLLTVIGLTAWWQYNRAARSQAEIDFKAALEAGQAALQKKDFFAAAQEFGKGVEAVNLLQRKDIAAEQVRQRHRELTAINSLLQRSLSELLEAARNTKQTDGPAAAESEFAHLYAGRWIVLQTEIAPSTPPGGSVPVWEQRVQINDDVMLLMAALPVFAKVAVFPAPQTAAPTERQDAPNNDLGWREIVFAAQVQSLRWDADKSHWAVMLDPRTGFLWSDYDLILAAGLAPDELHTEAQLKSLLTQQSHWIGVIE